MNATYPPSWNGYTLQQSYDGDRLRVKKVENGNPTYYLRSTILGGQVVAELGAGGNWTRGYIYMGGQLLAIQQGDVRWAEQDPVVKSQRLSDASGNWRTWLELDAWGGQTPRSGGHTSEQPRQFTTYERDANSEDEAMHRRYNRWWSRFSQPDPYDGSMNLADPQSFNRYSYVQNDPINFTDPTGLCTAAAGDCVVTVTSGSSQSIEPGLISGLNGSASVIAVVDTGAGGGGTDPGGLEPQNPRPLPPESQIPPKPPNPACDDKLKKLFGGKDAVAAGSGYEPSGMQGPQGGSSFRPHLYRTLHIYGNETATGTTGVYAPAGGGVPFSRENVAPGAGSYGIHYNQLGNARNVTLVISHVANYTNPGRITSRTQIGNIGGPGGTSGGQYPYIHSHLAILNSQGKNLSFVDVFCK